MSESILDHGYIPEEHAPDPVISHGDPTPPGKVGIWLFLASEIMFFIGILGSYIVIRSGWPHLFEMQGRTLNKLLAGVNTLVLIFSSLTMAMAVDAAQKADRSRLVRFLSLTFLCALTFMLIKAYEYNDKFHHYTMVVREGNDTYVYDGHLHEHDGHKSLTGVRGKLHDDDIFNINFAGKEWIEESARAHQEIGSGQKLEEKTWDIHGTVAQEVNYGPWKNLFFSCYFTATGIHGIHVLAGMIPLGILTIQGTRKRIFPAATEYVGLYWHFVDLVWIFLFPLMYLI
ncbi:MAG TPA: cytochrome c oxidase subunit 3 [Tepidisphaeraceae bacterium]